MVIPDSVISIGKFAFENNNITTVEIGTGISIIDEWAFRSNPLVTVDIKGNPRFGVVALDFQFSDITLLRYGGTCEELNLSSNVFGYHPKTIITTDNNSCEFTSEH